MLLTSIIDEDVTNYKKCAMFIGTSKCDGKCWKELDLPPDTCQNDALNHCSELIDVSREQIIDRYLSNPLTEAIVFGGLEPLMEPNEIFNFLDTLRNKYHCVDDVVIYSGYYPEEVQFFTEKIKANYINVIVKFGRYVPGKSDRYDEVLGVRLISDNQFAIKIS